MRHELIGASALLFVGSTVASFLAFLFNFFIVRLLSPSLYGEFASLMSLITLATLPTQLVVNTIVKYVTEYLTREEWGKAGKLYRTSIKGMTLVACVLFGIMTALAPFLQAFLRIDSISLILLTNLIIAAAYIQVIHLAFIQGMMRFGLLSVLNISGSLGKLLLGLIFVWIGWGVLGALFAVFLVFLIPFLVAIYPLRRIIQEKVTNIHLSKKEIIGFALPTALTMLSLSALTTMDVVIARNLFSAEQAGVYAGLALIGRVIFYFTTPIGSVLFPLVVKKQVKQESYQRLFLLALLLILSPGVVMSIWYSLLPEFTIKFFLGGGIYTEAASLLWAFGIMGTLFSLVYVCATYFLSLRRLSVMWIALCGAVSQSGLLLLIRPDMTGFVQISISIMVVQLFAFLVYYAKVYAEKTTTISTSLRYSSGVSSRKNNPAKRPLTS